MMVGRFIGAGELSKYQPRPLLTVCLLGGAACVGISFVLQGMAAVYAMLAAGLFPVSYTHLYLLNTPAPMKRPTIMPPQYNGRKSSALPPKSGLLSK